MKNNIKSLELLRAFKALYKSRKLTVVPQQVSQKLGISYKDFIEIKAIFDYYILQSEKEKYNPTQYKFRDSYHQLYNLGDITQLKILYQHYSLTKKKPWGLILKGK